MMVDLNWIEARVIPVVMTGVGCFWALVFAALITLNAWVYATRSGKRKEPRP